MIAKIRNIMAKHPDICCAVFSVAFVILASKSYSQVRHSVTQAQPFPTRFFSQETQVEDVYDGDLTFLEDAIQQKEIVFVMYYAPWCAKSMELRSEFSKVAKYMKNKVAIIAINCWWTEGQCRQQRKFFSYPIFFVHMLHRDPYWYQGIPAAEHMAAFIETFLLPLTYIPTHLDMVQFITNHDTSIIGNFNLSKFGDCLAFDQFYYAKLRLHATDSYNKIPFGVLTNDKLGNSYRIPDSGTVILYRSLNVSLIYPRNFNITASQLVNWISSNLQQPVVQWVVPSGTKSLRLNKHIMTRPTVLLFTENDPIVGYNSQYHMLREVALDYNNCDDKDAVKDIIKSSINQQQFHMQKFSTLLFKCRQLRKHSTYNIQNNCCLSIVYDNPTSSRAHNVCDVCLNKHIGHHDKCAHIAPLSSLLFSSSSKIQPMTSHVLCQNRLLNYNIAEVLSSCCSYKETVTYDKFKQGASMTKSRDIHTLVGNQRHLQHKCDLLHLNRLQGYRNRLLPVTPQYELKKDFTGLGCRTNKTVAFVAMDIKYHREFLDRLEPNTTGTVLVIFDERNEAKYKMLTDYTKQNIVRFVQNYTMNELRPRLQSSAIIEQSCANIPCIKEISSDTFHRVVMDNTKDVILLYYTLWCGFCSALSHVYLALARYFQDEQSVVFARINGDKNDLPWQYTVESYPSIVLYPALRKSESIPFPDDIPKTLPNLVHFVLKHAQKSVKAKAALKMCSKACINKNKGAVLHMVRKIQKNIHDTKIKIYSTLNYIETLEIEVKNIMNTDIVGHTASLAEHTLGQIKQYLLVLRKRLNHQNITLKSAKMTRTILIKNSGNFLERKLLVQLMNVNERYRGELDKAKKVSLDEKAIGEL